MHKDAVVKPWSPCPYRHTISHAFYLDDAPLFCLFLARIQLLRLARTLPLFPTTPWRWRTRHSLNTSP